MHTHLRRGPVAIAVTACGLVALLAGCSSSGNGSGGGSQASGSGDQNYTVRLAMEAGNFDELPDWVAVEKGFYKDQGLNVEVDQIKTGTTGVKALLSGQIDMATGGGAAVAQADSGGGDVKFVGGLLQVSPYVIAAKPDIKSMADLKGKTFGVSEFGSSSDTAARQALTKSGLTPDKDIQILQLGGNSQRLAAVSSGSATATVLSPDAAGLLDQAGLHVVKNLADLDIETVHLALISTQSFMDKHPNLSQQVRTAIGKALDYVKDPANKDDVLQIISKYMKAKPTDPNVLSTYDYYQTTKVPGVYPPDDKMLPASVQADIDAAKQSDPTVGKLKPSDIVAKGALASQ